MTGLPNVMKILVYFNPCGIFICYVILFVVRAEENVEDCERVILCDDNDDKFGHQSNHRYVKLSVPTVIKECSAAKDGAGVSQQFCKNGRREVTKDRPFQSVFSFIPVLAPTSSQITNKVCRKHSRMFVQQLQQYKLWALRMYDSSAKLPSGILRGNVNQLGDFDQCLSIVAKENPSIVGKYCLASVDVHATALNNSDTNTLAQAVHLAQSYGFIKSSYRDPGHFIPQFTTIKWALCVPASCTYADVQHTLVEALHNYNQTIGLSFDVHVDPDMCYVKNEKGNPLSSGTVTTLAFFATTVCVAVIATIRDTTKNSRRLHEQGQLERLLMAFSLRKNIRELTADLPAEGDIHCIYGVRAICTTALYMAHKVITLAFSPYSNRVALTEASNESWTTILRTSQIYTDSFLMLSGVLSSFNLSKEIERKKHIDSIKKYMARFIRLTPALLAVLIFYAYVMEHLGSGPQWNMTVRRNADICKENLWKNLFYIQNFFPFEQMCATHTHQLALDMQLSLLSPLLVTLLWQWRAGGVILLLCLHALSAFLRYIATLRNQLSNVIYHGMTVKQLYRTANQSYSLSLHRATPYLLGISLGCILHKTSKNVRISKAVLWAGWLLAIYLAYLSVFLPSDMGLRHYRYDVHNASVYAAFSPISWSLALGWLIWTCYTGNGGALNTLLCCKALVIVSRISYAVYLTQFAVFFYNVGSIRASEHFSLLRSVDMAELLAVLVISVVVTLLFDLPMQEVKSIVFGGGNRRVKVT